MIARERTAQQLDPIGTLAGVPMIILVGIVIVVYAVYSTLQQGDQITRPAFAAVALGLIVATTAFFVFSARAARAPLSVVTHAIIVLAALLASSLFSASLWGTNRLVQDDWGQIAVALLLLGLALFRPPWEIIISAVACSCLLGATAMAEGPSLEVRDSTWVYATVVAGPVLIIALASAAYARVVISALLAWQKRASEAARQLEPEVRASAARMLQQDEVTLLNAEAVPFLSDVLGRDTLTVDDLERARSIADTLRAHASAEAHAGWLAHVSEADDRVHDPRMLADGMNDDQRAVLAAFLDAVRRLPQRPEDAVIIDLAESSGRCLCAVSTRSDARDLTARSALLPYLSAFRPIATGARLRIRRGHIALRFEYVAS